MSDKNPYADMFVAEGDAPGAAPKSTAAKHGPTAAPTDAQVIPDLKKVLYDAKQRMEDSKPGTITYQSAKDDVDMAMAEIARLQGSPAAAAPASSAPAEVNPYIGHFVTSGDTSATPVGGPDAVQAGVAAAGAALGAGLGARKKPSADSLSARLMEHAHGLPPGALTLLEGKLNPHSLENASLATAQELAPRPPVAAPAVVPPEAPLSGMERWAASQVGEGSVLPKNVVAQATSTYANDPTGAPQIIQREAANTRKARQLVPATAMQTSPGGLPFVESQQQQQARVASEVAAQRQAAIDMAMNQPVGTHPNPEQQRPTPNVDTAKALRNAALRSNAMQRVTNVGQRGLFGAGTAAQAYGMASDAQQKKPIDWQQWLSFLGNLGGTFGPVTSKVPLLGRIPVAGPLATAFQVPYAIKHREEIMRALTMGDVMPPGIVTGQEATQSAELGY